MNAWGNKKIPFLFLIDFEMKDPLLWKLDGLDSKEVLYHINEHTNAPTPDIFPALREWHVTPPSFSAYQLKFDQVLQRIHYGDSYLANLTIKTRVDTSNTLEELFYISQAKYKCCVQDRFVFFSPETFVTIRDGRISTFPMKGTADAGSVALTELQADLKELAEHVTIVDLLRNDLSLIADHVDVARFRYIDQIKTNNKKLLQVSSEIVGTLPDDYERHLGEIVAFLLPAGSVSGAPKRKTLQILAEAEKEPRGYYTGVVGIFDGRKLDSGVAIRFLEKAGDHFCYRSGGGITAQSLVWKEYAEALDKVYVPIN